MSWRDVMCGELRAHDAGRRLTVAGWADTRRDHGGLVFVDLRDHTGKLQLVINPERSAAAAEVAHEIRNEFVLQANLLGDAGCLQGTPCQIGTASATTPLAPPQALAHGTVILGGSLSGLLELARPEIEASFTHYAHESQSRTTQFRQPELGADSALLGAAEVAFAELLADPLAAAALPA